MTLKYVLYDWGGLNVWLFHIINNVHSPLLDGFMLLGTALADHANFACYAAALALVSLAAQYRGGRQKIIPWHLVLTVLLLGYVADGWLVGMLKAGFAFPRPALALSPGSVYLTGTPELNLQHSLPSGHASFATLLAASLWPVLRRYGRCAAVFFVVWVCVSRISLGAHFPADVLAGTAICLTVVCTIRWGLRYATARI